MSIILEYLLGPWWTQNTLSNESVNVTEKNMSTTQSPSQKEVTTKMLISPSDLLNVKLKPVVNVIPGPARNMPLMNSFNLSMLNRAQLQEILKVKLRPTKIIEKKIHYEPKHPVLRELLNTVVKVC